MDHNLKAPQSTSGDAIHRLASGTTAFLPGPEGILVNQLVGLIAPPLQRRQQKFLEEIAVRLNALEATGILQVNDLCSNEGFLSILVQAARVATHNHRKEKLRLLQDAIISAAISHGSGSDSQQMFVRYIDELTPEHVILLSFLNESRSSDWVRHVQDYEALHLKAVEGMGFNHGKPLFALWCEDLKVRWLIRISDQVNEFPGIHSPNSMVLMATGNPDPRVLVTDGS